MHKKLNFLVQKPFTVSRGHFRISYASAICRNIVSSPPRSQFLEETKINL
eukprot:UN02994